MKKQIKSRERVKNQGEVFTNEREIKEMCDLVPQECDRIDSKILEPACGDGNFLIEILSRRLKVLSKKYKNWSRAFEKYSIFAIANIYGVDIMLDNVIECRKRIFNLWDKEYTKICKKECNDLARNAVKYILEKNILCGNALSYMMVDDKQNDTNKPIIFTEWSLIGNNEMKRKEYRFDVMIKAKDNCSLNDNSISKFLTIEPVTGDLLPLPINEYYPIDYRKLGLLND